MAATLTGSKAILMGEQSLLIQCAEKLLAKDVLIIAIISQAKPILQWALEHDIPVKAEDNLTEIEYDYFFSIANLKIINSSVLSRAQKAAINFHDGPLPEYAGVNVPVWAILNQHSYHGVTWHYMTQEVDQGEIIARQTFDIEPSDTAFTLNARCYEYALSTFDQVLLHIIDDQFTPTSQASTQRQHYYKASVRPKALATLDFNQPIASLERLIRALDFSRYDNPIALPKLIIDNDWYWVRKATSASLGSHGMGPGSIVDLDDQQLTIRCQDGYLQLIELCDSSGTITPIKKIVERHQLNKAKVLPLFTQAQCAELTTLHQRFARHQAHWLSTLKQLTDLAAEQYFELTPVEINPDSAELFKLGHIAINELNKQVTDVAISDVSDVSIVVLLLYWAKLNQLQSVGAFIEEPLDNLAWAPWFHNKKPIILDINNHLTFLKCLKQIKKQSARHKKWGMIPNDLLLAHRNLLAQFDEKTYIHIEKVVSIAGYRKNTPIKQLHFVVDDAGEVGVWLNKKQEKHPLINQLALGLSQFGNTLKNNFDLPVQHLSSITSSQKSAILTHFNEPASRLFEKLCIHQGFEQKVAEHPNKIALLCQNDSLSYQELNNKANQLAHYLLEHYHIEPEQRVGILLKRSTTMIISLLAVLKAGATYLPLDPDYPQDRIHYMIEDAAVSLVITEDSVHAPFESHLSGVKRLDYQQSLTQITQCSQHNPTVNISVHNTAYIIYTSGSTGRPKGVLVEHISVANFFTAMTPFLKPEKSSTFLGLTSISFDISVLELFYSLSHGFKVVLYQGFKDAQELRLKHQDKAIDLSLFYFSSDEATSGQDKYRLLIEGAKFADQHNFKAVWTPERHFHSFGGLYPSPAVVGGAIASLTKHISIRAGSCVLPLHHPVRVAEDWSVVDNLSNGRVGLSFATGWQPNDFILNKDHYEKRYEEFENNINVVRALWRGEKQTFPGPNGEVEVEIRPRPVQKDLPFWVTAAGNPNTFQQAGAMGANILTHLLGQNVDELKQKIQIYHTAREQAGYKDAGKVTLMLHTFVAEDEQIAKNTVWQPLKEYLKTAASLIKNYASSFPAFKQLQGDAKAIDEQFKTLSAQDMDALLEHSTMRYYQSDGLFGTPYQCAQKIDHLKSIGVDEVACLIDFGIDSDTVLKHLPLLHKVKLLVSKIGGHIDSSAHPIGQSIPQWLDSEPITHLQCTPSQAAMLAADTSAHPGLARLQCMLVGGEALSASLAVQLKQILKGRLFNVYGPTETTIWSSIHEIKEESDTIPIGKPLLNTQMLVLDQQLNLVPPLIPGDLYISGEGVVRGYWQKPTLTASRFIVNPYKTGGSRLYKTGDRACFNEQGVLTYLGRSDHQVKLRGYRIELGEIESRLMEIPEVSLAIVMVREDTANDQQLVAYLKIKSQSSTQIIDQLKAHLKEQLPEFMQPSKYLILDTIPLTPNGKINRNALPKPNNLTVERPLEKNITKPETETQIKLINVWRQILHRQDIGITDNFFDLGGHSLLAVQVLNELRKTFSKPLQMTDLFRYTTIESLARFLAVEADDNQSPLKTRGQARRSARGKRR